MLLLDKGCSAKNCFCFFISKRSKFLNWTQRNIQKKSFVIVFQLARVGERRGWTRHAGNNGIRQWLCCVTRYWLSSENDGPINTHIEDFCTQRLKSKEARKKDNRNTLPKDKRHVVSLVRKEALN